jgi:hypothetical protein
MERSLQVLVVLLGLVLVVSTTMFSPPQTLIRVHAPLSEWLPLWPVEVGLNVALFVPLGAAVALRGRPRQLWLLVALSVGIETVQLVLAERQSTPLDVVANTAGALIGFTAVRVALHRWGGAAGSTRSVEDRVRVPVARDDALPAVQTCDEGHGKPLVRGTENIVSAPGADRPGRSLRP